MSPLRSRVEVQFRRPQGVLGRAAGWIMSHRASNVERSRWTVEQLDLEPGHRVLELGFGPGRALAECARRVDPGTVVGVDHSETMCRVAARRNAAAIREGRVVLHTAAFEALPELGEPFDRIFSVNALTFVAEPEKLLCGLRDRLCPGGRIAVTFQSRRAGATSADSRRGGEAIAEQLSAAGFEQRRIEVLPATPADAVCVLAEAPR